MPVRVAEPHREVPLTLNLKGVPLEQTLDVICLKLGLSWDTDGKSIVIENEPSRLRGFGSDNGANAPRRKPRCSLSAPPPFRPFRLPETSSYPRSAQSVIALLQTLAP